MDVIQSTISLFSALLNRVRAIGNMLVTNYLPEIDEVEKKLGIFWIFNL